VSDFGAGRHFQCERRNQRLIPPPGQASSGSSWSGRSFSYQSRTFRCHRAPRRRSCRCGSDRTALRDALRFGKVTKNATSLQAAPKVDDEEMVIVKDIPAFIESVRSHRLFAMGMVGLFTGLRIGEALALRWGRVDLDGKVIQVREALEQTKKHGVRFKPPKSKAGRRDLTLPDILIETLQAHRRDQLELRIKLAKLGAGKLPDDALLFAGLDGEPRSPSSVSRAWSDATGVGYHNLRHTHASQLIDAGVDIVTISKRLGHSKPDVTLRIYSHLFKESDAKAAAAINAALR
jgi:integrase